VSESSQVARELEARPPCSRAWFRIAGPDPMVPGPVGVYRDGEWHDLAPLLGPAAFDSAGLLASGQLSGRGLEALAARLGAETRLAERPRFGLPVPHPRKILCIAKNYAAHAKEMGGEAPKEPRWFAKLSEALLPDGDDVPLPRGLPEELDRVDYEGELCLVIGGTGRDVAEADAAQLIAGATLLNDVTARLMQKADRGEGYPWLRAKSFDGFAPVGPWVVPFEDLFGGEIPADATPDLKLELRVNGETRQSSRSSMTIHSVARLISFLSQHHTLRPGDLIATGTPEGIGPLASGDRVELEIERIGTLRHGVR
jgi:2-keto-4-pentenoate hydratase/2-oxohepta-3-ene-1,7-dioic acid hydratase in catechol pathway